MGDNFNAAFDDRSGYARFSVHYEERNEPVDYLAAQTSSGIFAENNMSENCIPMKSSLTAPTTERKHRCCPYSWHIYHEVQHVTVKEKGAPSCDSARPPTQNLANNANIPVINTQMIDGEAPDAAEPSTINVNPIQHLPSVSIPMEDETLSTTSELRTPSIDMAERSAPEVPPPDEVSMVDGNHSQNSGSPTPAADHTAQPIIPQVRTQTTEMLIPEQSTPEYLAMSRNPVTIADPESVSRMTNVDAEQPRLEVRQADAVTNETAAVNERAATASLRLQATTSIQRISFDDYLDLSEITFEWSDSYDAKDWLRLRAILAPTLTVDYTDVNGHRWDSMSAEDFVSIMSNIGFVGDPLVHTQHHIGASKWQKLSDEEVVGHHQLRAAHQRYTARDMKTVENKGNGHAMVRHLYRKIGGRWKLAGLRPTVRWNEFELEKIFTGPGSGVYHHRNCFDFYRHINAPVGVLASFMSAKVDHDQYPGAEVGAV